MYGAFPFGESIMAIRFVDVRTGKSRSSKDFLFEVHVVKKRKFEKPSKQNKNPDAKKDDGTREKET